MADVKVSMGEENRNFYMSNHDEEGGFSSVHPPSYNDVPGTVPLNTANNPGPPPSYDDVINPDAPPPSYNSLYGQVREARKASSSFVDFVRKVLILLMGTMGCTIVIGVIIFIPTSMIVIGSLYLYDCPAETNIPIYLIVGGAFWIVKSILNIRDQCRDTSEEPRNKPHEAFLNCFLFVWFVAGCSWTYKIYPPNYEDTMSLIYCHKTLYMFAFWQVTSIFIMFGLVTTCLCCLTISALSSQD